MNGCSEDDIQINHTLPLSEEKLPCEDKIIINECAVLSITEEISLQDYNEDKEKSESQNSSPSKLETSEIEDNKSTSQLSDNGSSEYFEDNLKLKSTIENLESIVSQQQKKLKEYESKLYDFEQKTSASEKSRGDLESRLLTAIKQCDVAMKEKESIVMRYAVSEKCLLEQKAIREQTERKLLDIIREKDLLQNKLANMITEKARICQMLDNKCYDFKGVTQDLERTKTDLNALETKLKWSQNSLRTEIELHKESSGKVESLTARLQEATNEVDKTKRDCQESIKSFYQSQDNRAHVLDQQLKEQQAIHILEKHERDERENQITSIKSELDRLQSKHQGLIQENNTLSLKVQQLERERLENEHKLSELRGCADQVRQDEANLNSLSATVEQLKLQLQHEQEQRESNSQQVTHLKQRNSELETDMDSCHVREAEMLLFTQQLTDKNVRLQSEFSALETKVQQLTCEQTLLKRNIKKQETQSDLLSEQLDKERTLRQEENQVLARHLAEKTKLSEQLNQQLEDQKGENLVIKRKCELSMKEVTRELKQCRKKLENYERVDNGTNSRSSSSSSLNVTDAPSSSPFEILTPPVHVSNTVSEVSDHQVILKSKGLILQTAVIQPDNVLDRQVLIDHIIKLQRASAKKSEKLDFLEEHVQTLVSELQRKSRLLQSYIMREQAGTLSSNKMDDNKAELAKHNGVMASVYGSRVTDNSLTLELSLDINRKLQAILEDTLLKNITLKENVDTLGAEIERLSRQKSKS